MSNLHLDPPATMHAIGAAHRWLLPGAATVVAALTAGATQGWLVWDEPITRWVIDSRSPALDRFFRRVSFLGSTRVVLTVSTLAAALAWRRCPRLAVAIVVIALARPLAEFALKELVARERPAGHRLVDGRGYSFPSGHPLATVASWGVLPLVAALYTRRRSIWWSIVVAVWTLVALVAVSRVWLGVHWASDVVASIALALLGIAMAERTVLPSTPARRGGHGPLPALHWGLPTRQPHPSETTADQETSHPPTSRPRGEPLLRSRRPRRRRRRPRPPAT